MINGRIAVIYITVCIGMQSKNLQDLLLINRKQVDYTPQRSTAMANYGFYAVTFNVYALTRPVTGRVKACTLNVTA